MRYRVPLLIGLFIGLIVSFGLLYFLVLPQEQSPLGTASLEVDSLDVSKTPINQPATISSSAGEEGAADTIPLSEDWKEGFHPKFLMGKFTPNDHPDMIRVPDEYTDRDGTYFLLRQTLNAFKEMHAAAKADSIDLVIVSAFRNFDRQKAIWEAKWNGQRLLEGKDNAQTVYPDPADRASAILRYSSMPGSSRHHWGTDLDINNLNNSYFASGAGLKTYHWLQANAARFGFCQPYTAKGDLRPNGYEEEKWHWTYMPLSVPLTDFAEQYLRDSMIQGFAGAESALSIGVVEKYVLGINGECR